MNDFWFTPKLKGYGAVPATWEGYTFVIVFLAVVSELRFRDDAAGKDLFIDLSATDDCRSRLDTHLSDRMRVEN
ncbi:hypothetical protein V1282_000701 [Nitrobacteraceae bacterium AZCC 2146]